MEPIVIAFCRCLLNYILSFAFTCIQEIYSLSELNFFKEKEFWYVDMINRGTFSLTGRLVYQMSSVDVVRAELALAVLYLNKAEARDKICRAIQYGSRFVSKGEPGTAQNVEKTTTLARKVFRLFKVVYSDKLSSFFQML